ncbi:MAG: DEAD/DEAH box helicase family protein [Desulfobacterales bacterium]|nr:DEAD/DEAH box helicase family protein [Desulfobacterales bacterium]
MTEQYTIFKSDDLVKHEEFGTGRVEYDKGETVIVRFEHGIEECEKVSLTLILSPMEALELDEWHRPLKVISRAQAEVIRSLNDTWGVFSKSRIALLPHQLWVCKKVLENWPTRWLVADDVGLGKTIEAGLILMPLLSKGIVKRFLILCPASLVEQWQQRLRIMFDIRCAQYVTQADTEKADFWGTHNQVVASMQTIRLDRSGRHDRLFDSEPWDLVMVDEAHHLNADEDTGFTLGYRVVNQLEEKNLIQSMVFFTGTPHRGKNYNFLQLLRILRPETFDPNQPLQSQLHQLSQVMIRNNKQNVTDLRGKKLFKPMKVTPETFTYSDAEDRFYSMLTEFISTGQAYATLLESQDRRAVILVLITMQKLASSSVAAIRRALNGRLARIATTRQELGRLRDTLSEYDRSEREADMDRLAQLEETIVQLSSKLRLMEDEEPKIRELIATADLVQEETKIEKIIKIVEERYPDRKVLFFTEYKATQSLLMSRLMQHFGNGCVTFINGDNLAEEVTDASGVTRNFRRKREDASDDFNAGDVRFLVSTEAAGEGVDLQEQCHTLIHVDLPWNPMRLHQRVGRLNRYGQKEQVEVVTLRNPDTIESRIWDKLNSKIENIMLALREAMDEPEDLFQLVLGMTPPSLFRELFSQGRTISQDSLTSWFNQKTARFGNRDAIDTVRELVGHSAKFDYDQVSDQLPKVDLPELRPFFLNALTLNGRRPQEDDKGLTFKTPENWLGEPGIRRSYEDMVFDRHLRSKDAQKRILGVGHRVVDKALVQTTSSTACVATVPEKLLKGPLLVFQIWDRVTTSGGHIRKAIVGISVESDKAPPYTTLKDWELLQKLNELSEGKGVRAAKQSVPVGGIDNLKEVLKEASIQLDNSVKKMDLPFKHPETELVCAICPADW